MTTNVKAFLCSQDGTHNFPIIQKVTTIGRENCDIIICNNSVDVQHAVIEYMEDESCFVIQDLNTTNGTYINDCRIQNAAVRLAEQDIIRFGNNSLLFQFLVQHQQSQSQFITSIPPINLAGTIQRSQPLQLINQTVPARGNALGMNASNQSSGFWLANQLPNASLITINNQVPNANGQINKPPASLRTRPNSTASLNRSISVMKDIGAAKNTTWTKSYTGSQLNTNFPLPVVDSETYRQEEAVEVSSRVSQLERELKMKTIEIKDLKEKVSFYQSQQNMGSGQNSELEQVKRDKSIACGLVNTMQKDLANKDGTISKLAREIEGYKRELKDRETKYADLEEKYNIAIDPKRVEEEKQNKEKELIVLRTKFKTTEDKIVDLTNQILHIKNDLEDSNRQTAKSEQREKTLKEEIEHIKSQYLDVQRAERTVRIDLEQIKRTYDKFRNLIIQSIYSLPDVSRPSGETSDDDLLELWRTIIKEKTTLSEQLVTVKENLKHSEEISKETVKNVNSFKNVLNSIEQRLETGSRRSSLLEVELKSLENSNVHESLSKLKDCVTKIYTNELKTQVELEDGLKLLFEIDLKNELSSRDLLKVAKNKIENLKTEERLKLESKIKELKENHQLELANIRKESENTKSESESIKSKLDSIKNELELELKQKHNEEINSVKNELNLLIKEEISKRESFETSYSALIEEKANLSKTIEMLGRDLEQFNESSNSQSSFVDQIKGKLIEAETELKIQQEDHLNEIGKLKSSLGEAEKQFNIELNIHKEQLKQHSITIVNFEKEVSQLKEKEFDYLNQIEKLKANIASVGNNQRKFFSTMPPAVAARPVSPPSPPPKQVARETSGFDFDAMNKTIELLRSECSTYKVRLSEQDDLIKLLRRDLAGASAKLSDAHGEMTEKQKRELERNRHLVLDQQRELSDTRSHLAKLSEIVDRQTKQLETLKSELTKSKSLVDKYQKTAEENGLLAVELKAKLDGMETQIKKVETVKKEEGKITTELTAYGAQCKGERHEQVILRQREALNELRQKLKIIEQTRPQAPTNQQQLQQQIMLLKKQLAEVRASQALTDDIAKQANLARGNDQTFLMLEEKTAHFETQTALDASEESFFNIIKAMSSILEINGNDLTGMRSFNNLSPDEKQNLVNDRGKSIELICIRIRNLMESLRRKEQLLKDYEIDLAKLRQAEFLLQKKSEQLDTTQVFTRSKEDEIEYLKESLKNLKLELEREKLLNDAIKQKKSINSVQQLTERVRRVSTDTLHHHCPPQDLRSVNVKKTMVDKIKRKDYELKTLKDELKSRNEELSSLTNRVTIAEKSHLSN